MRNTLFLCYRLEKKEEIQQYFPFHRFLAVLFTLHNLFFACKTFFFLPVHLTIYNSCLHDTRVFIPSPCHCVWHSVSWQRHSIDHGTLGNEEQGERKREEKTSSFNRDLCSKNLSAVLSILFVALSFTCSGRGVGMKGEPFNVGAAITKSRIFVPRLQ